MTKGELGHRFVIVLGVVTVVVTVVTGTPRETLPTAVCETLRNTREHYTGPMTAGQLGEMLNAVAWTHRTEGFGLNRKSAGNNCPSPVGSIACDILQRQADRLMWDVVVDAGGTSLINCGEDIGPQQDPNARPWVAPVAPPPDADKPDAAKIVELLTRLSNELLALRSDVAAVHGHINILEEKIDKLPMCPAVEFPDYVARINFRFWPDQTIRLTPVPRPHTPEVHR